MHWMMWIFWGTLAGIFVVTLIVDVLTKRKYSLNKKESTLNQDMAEAEAKRQSGSNGSQGGMF